MHGVVARGIIEFPGGKSIRVNGRDTLPPLATKNLAGGLLPFLCLGGGGVEILDQADRDREETETETETETEKEWKRRRLQPQGDVSTDCSSLEWWDEICN